MAKRKVKVKKRSVKKKASKLFEDIENSELDILGNVNEDVFRAPPDVVAAARAANTQKIEGVEVQGADLARRPNIDPISRDAEPDTSQLEGSQTILTPITRIRRRVKTAKGERERVTKLRKQRKSKVRTRKRK